MSHTARIEAVAPGHYRVEGPLGFATVARLVEQGDAVLGDAGSAEARWRIDLGGVGQVDSAGLALLLRWLRRAAVHGASVQFDNMPAQMRAIARAGGLAELLAAA